MSNNYGLNKYKQTSVTTASRGQILLMLYDGALKYCKLAIEAVNTRNLVDKGKYILKVQDIINELTVTLDHKVGGEISKELERLYNFMIEQITEANIKNEAKPLENTMKLLETLREGWAAAVQQVEKSQIPGGGK
jgi:flagellar protein FliS